MICSACKKDRIPDFFTASEKKSSAPACMECVKKRNARRPGRGTGRGTAIKRNGFIPRAAVPKDISYFKW